MKEQKRILDNRIEKWKGEIEQIDDILVIGIKINETFLNKRIYISNGIYLIITCSTLYQFI